MSWVEVAALIVSAGMAAGVIWIPVVCLFRRAFRRRHRADRIERLETSLLDVIGGAEPDR